MQLYFEIQADNPERAVEFYRKLFGWKFEETHGLPVKYWRIETDSGRGGLLERPAQTPPMECGTNAFTCSFEVDNFDPMAEKIAEMGGRVALPKFPVPGICWQGYFLDTEGNTFGIYQPDANAG